MYDNKTMPHSTVSDMMYKKYKSLVNTPPDLFPRFCKVSLSNANNSACFLFWPDLLDKGMQPINYNG